MKKERAKMLAVIAGAILFNLVFWQEEMALNTILYNAFLLTIVFFLYPEARHVSTVRWLTLGHLICLAMILVHNTMLSKIAFITTLALLAGFVEYIHRSVWFAGGSMLMNAVFVPATIINLARSQKTVKQKRRRKGKFVRFAIIPFILALIFFLLYSGANSVFSDFSVKISDAVSQYFSDFFEFFSIKRFFFLLLGLYLTAWIVLRNKRSDLEKLEQRYKDDLVRKRTHFIDRKGDLLNVISSGLMGRLMEGMMALKNMNTVGLISLGVLNLLLLAINIIDIKYVWFGFQYGADVDLQAIIHKGTDLLIISILLAMTVLIIFFRGNLNFYKANKWLKYGAYIWIIQNCILVVSVFLRDYHYININGLAYKRIGVLFYLALVFIGLISVFWKIYAKKTTYFLFRVNAWAVIVLLVASTTINWDELIASYNFSRKNEILMPVEFMMTLSNKALPILDQNIAVLEEQYRIQSAYNYITWPCDDCIQYVLNSQQSQFMREQADYSWLSYNFADASVKEYFERKNKLTVK